MPVIKRYSNRKLYDTDAKRYVTLDDIANAIRQGQEVKVLDHATGSDLTSLTLMQIIFEEEKKMGELLPQVVLTHLLRRGSDTLETLRSRLLAAFDPQQQAQEEIERRVNHLVTRGNLTRVEADALIDLLTRPQAPDETPEGPADQTQASSPPDSNIQTLLKQVELLENELAQLKKNT